MRVILWTVLKLLTASLLYHPILAFNASLMDEISPNGLAMIPKHL